MTYRRIREEGKKILARAGIAEPEENAWILFEFVFGIDRTRYFLCREEEAPEDGVERYRELLARRSTHVPVQYLTGFAWFMGLEFSVNENVLIPRQDTEVLVEEARKEIRKEGVQAAGRTGRDESLRILDMCAGSGCIGISLAKGLADQNIRTELTEADISEAALAVARKNGERHDVVCEYVRSDLFSELGGRQYDYILSNPPYIETAVIGTLMEEVRDYEPTLALDGGADGLSFYRRIAEESRDFLREEGRIFLEIGYDQGEAAAELLMDKGFQDVFVIRDLAGNPRVVKARWLGNGRKEIDLI